MVRLYGKKYLLSPPQVLTEWHLYTEHFIAVIPRTKTDFSHGLFTVHGTWKLISLLLLLYILWECNSSSLIFLWEWHTFFIHFQIFLLIHTFVIGGCRNHNDQYVWFLISKHFIWDHYIKQCSVIPSKTFWNAKNLKCSKCVDARKNQRWPPSVLRGHLEDDHFQINDHKGDIMVTSGDRTTANSGHWS